MNNYVLINNQKDFDLLMDEIYEKEVEEIGIDLEGDYFRFRYGINLCLVQILFDKIVYIIDAFEIKNWNRFKNIMENENIEKVFYSCLFDIKVLKTVLGIETKNIFDIFFAAIHLNIRNNSLKNLLKIFLNIDFEKNKDLQLSNWNIRPLTCEQMKYASNDVFYLLDLKNKILHEIEKEPPKQQKSFFEKMKKIESQTDILFKDKIKKLIQRGKLSNEEKVFLTNFFNTREKLAKSIDVAPHHIISDSNLIIASKKKFISKEEWIKSDFIINFNEKIDEFINDFVKAGENSQLELKKTKL